MLKRIAMLSVALLLITSFVSALQVEDIQQDIQSNSEELTAFRADMTAQVSQLNQKIDKFATKEDVQALLEAHLTIVNNIIDNFRSMIIVSLILILLCFLGLFYSVYFYYKGRGRI